MKPILHVATDKELRDRQNTQDILIQSTQYIIIYIKPNCGHCRAILMCLQSDLNITPCSLEPGTSAYLESMQEESMVAEVHDVHSMIAEEASRALTQFKPC